MISQRPLASLALAVAASVLASCEALSYGANRNKDVAMIPQTTYLHLLKKTPFFNALTRPQLKWVIDHSREWEVQAGTVVGRCTTDEAVSDDLWVLLDGGWKIVANGKQHVAGNADAGKWFSASVAVQECQLVATEKSYVMKIVRADMDAMLAQGFSFGSHLDTGAAYYRGLF